MGPKPENHTCECLFSNTSNCHLGAFSRTPCKNHPVGLVDGLHPPKWRGGEGMGLLPGYHTLPHSLLSTTLP